MNWKTKLLLLLVFVSLGCAQPKRTVEDLLMAIQVNDLEGLRAVLDAGTSPNEKTKKGGTALYSAAYYGRPEMVSLLLEKGAKLDLVNPLSGQTELHVAAMRGHSKVCQLLIAAGAKVDYAKDLSVLQVATLSQHEDVVKILLAAGANTEHTNDKIPKLKGLTALHMAASKKSLAIVKLLVEKGAKLNARHGKGENALDIARRYKNVEIASYLAAKMK